MTLYHAIRGIESKHADGGMSHFRNPKNKEIVRQTEVFAPKVYTWVEQSHKGE